MIEKLGIGTHGWHHAEFFVVIALVVFLLYVPPRSASALSMVREFVDAHFGDSIGLYILHLGIALVIIGAVWSMQRVDQIGESLVLAAMGVLKLTKPNGVPPSIPANSSGTVDQVTTAHVFTPPTSPAAPPAGWEAKP